MKRPWSRSEKLLWLSPLLIGAFIAVVFYGPQIMRRALGLPAKLHTARDTQIRSMALSANGDLLAAAGALRGRKRGSGTIYIWNARTSQWVGTIPPVYKKDKLLGTTGFDIYGLTFSPDAKYVGFSRVSQNWELYDVATQNLIWRFNNFVSDAQFSPDGLWVALSGYNQIAIVRASDGQLRTVCKTNPTNSKHIAWSPDGKLVASIGSYDKGNPIEFHSASNGKLVKQIKSDQGFSGDTKETVASVNFSPDGKFLVSASSLGQRSSLDNEKIEKFAPIRLYDVSSGLVVWEIKTTTLGGTKDNPNSICDAIFSPDGRTIAAYEYRAGKVFLLDSATAAINKTLTIGNAERSTFFVPPGLKFSPDGKRLFVRGKEDILFWNLP